MHFNKNISIFLSSFFAILLLLIYCIGPTKPPFTEAAKFTDKQIKTQGTPVVDSSFLLYVSAEGTAPLLYQWYKNNVEISNARDDTLKFDLLSISDSGNYQCFVWNDDGSDTSLIYALKVLTPPSITTPNKRIQTSSSIPEIDSLFYMYITATGSDTLHYQWYLNSILQQGIDNDTFLVTALSHSDTGIYQCIVSNNWGTDTSLTYNLSFLGNHPPDWVEDTMVDAVKEMITYTMILSDSCTDPDTGDIVTFTLGAGTPAGDSITSDSIYTYTPTFNNAGVYYIELWAKDGLDSSSAILKLSVIDSNRAPQFMDSLPLDLYRINESEQLFIPFAAEDPDGDSVEVIVLETSLPHPLDILLNESQLTWQSTNSDSGAFNVILGATDKIDTTNIEITVTVGDVNLPPEISIAGYQYGDTAKITEGTELRFTVTASDPDTGQVITLLPAKNLPPGAVYDITNSPVNGDFLYAPDFLVSNKLLNTTFPNVTFFATDSSTRAIDSFVIHITVLDSNRAPVCKDTSLTIDEDVTAPINLFATDPDNDPMLWSILEGPTHGKVDTSNGIIDTGSEFHYTAFNLTASPVDTIKIAIDDGVSTCEMFVIITINADNDPPVADNIDTLKLVEDQPTGVKFDISGTDPEGLILTWEVVSDPTKGTINKLNDTISTSLEAEYIPSADSCGSDSFTFRISDGVNNSQNITVYIFITPVNDKPTITITSYPSDTAYGKAANIVTSFSDVEGGIDSIFFIIDLKLDTSTKVSGLTQFTRAWKAPFASNVIGPHHIMAVISDVDGERDTSQTVTVSITGTLVSDTLSVRAILDSNGLNDKKVSDVTVEENGRIIDITWSSFTAIPIDTLIPEIGNLTGLEYLAIFENSLTTLPPEVGNLVLLNLFNFNNNQIYSLPSEIGDLINLTEINLSNNQLSDLPDDIVNLTNLTTLDLGYNHLDTLSADPWVPWANTYDPDWKDTQSTRQKKCLNQDR